MRSRYTAFVRGDGDYVLRTWHPDTRPPTLALDERPAPKWLGLNIVAVGREPPTVEFVARYRVGGRAQRLHERSRFVCEQGRWFYFDGILDPER